MKIYRPKIVEELRAFYDADNLINVEDNFYVKE